MSIGVHAVRNGVLIRAAEAVMPVTQREVQSNFCVYESLRVVGGHVVHLPEHLARLAESARLIALVHPFTAVQIDGWIRTLLASDAIEEATLRILVYGGPRPVLFVTAAPLLTYPASFYEEGVVCALYEGERFLPRCKTGNLLLNYLALEEARRQGGFEALLVDRNGLVLEGTRSNFYGFKDGALRTAPIGTVLDGITRQGVMRAAADLGIEVVEEALGTGELASCDEVFISATSMSAMPVRRIETPSGPVLYEGPRKRTRAISALVRSREKDETV